MCLTTSFDLPEIEPIALLSRARTVMVCRLLIWEASWVCVRRLLKLLKSECCSRILVMLKAVAEEKRRKNERQMKEEEIVGFIFANG